MDDRIKDVRVHYVKLPLKERFVISQNSRAFHESILIEIITECGVKGCGEAVPSKYVMNETIDGAMQFFKDALWKLKGKSVFNRNEVMMLFKKLHAPHCVMNAVNSAMIDAAGKLCRLPAYKLLGGEKRDIKTSATVSIGNVSETVKSAKRWLNEGFKALKIKVGLDVEEDIKRIKALRSISGEFDMYVDANQGYSREETLYFARHIEQFDVKFIEQPVNALDLSSLRYVKQHSPIPVMADESVKTPYDAVNVILMDAVHYINVKLTKAGGIDEALKVARIAEASYKKTMLGCMLGTPLLIAASYTAFNVAGTFQFADLDGFLTLAENPIEGGAYLENGFLKIREGYGLAVEKLNL